jgi:hypothetical protein
MIGKTKLIVALCALLTASGAAAVTYAGDDLSGTSVAPQPEPALARLTPAQAFNVRTAAVAEVQPRIASNFALFRDRPARPVPDELVAQIASPTRFGRNPALARSIDTANGTGWVVPGDGYLCLVVPDPVSGYGVGCTTTEVAIKQGLWLRLHGEDPEGPALDTLVLPDETKAVVDTATGSRVLEAGDDGVVSAAVKAAAPPEIEPAG